MHSLLPPQSWEVWLLEPAALTGKAHSKKNNFQRSVENEQVADVRLKQAWHNRQHQPKVNGNSNSQMVSYQKKGGWPSTACDWHFKHACTDTQTCACKKRLLHIIKVEHFLEQPQFVHSTWNMCKQYQHVWRKPNALEWKEKPCQHWLTKFFLVQKKKPAHIWSKQRTKTKLLR